MNEVTDYSKLSITLQIFGLLLAWGEAKKPFWFSRLENTLDKIANANLDDTLSLAPAIIEYLVVIFLVGGTLILGLKFQSSDFKFLYGGSITLILTAPFIVKKMKLFSGGNAMATLGLIIAAFGTAIYFLQ